MPLGDRRVPYKKNLYVGDIREGISWIITRPNGNQVDVDSLAVKFEMYLNSGTESEPIYAGSPKIALTATNVSKQPTIPVTANATTDYLRALDHGLSEGTKIVFSTDDTLPDGLELATPYYARNVSFDMFQVSDTPSGTVIDILDGGVGPHQFYIVGHVVYGFVAADVDTAGLYGAWFTVESVSDSTIKERGPPDGYGIYISINQRATS